MITGSRHHFRRPKPLPGTSITALPVTLTMGYAPRLRRRRSFGFEAKTLTDLVAGVHQPFEQYSPPEERSITRQLRNTEIDSNQ